MLAPSEELVALLREVDSKEAELKQLKLRLQRECSVFGQQRGLWGFCAEHLRRELLTNELRSKANGEQTGAA